MMIEAWLSHLSTQGKSPLTLKSYRRGVTHFIRWSEQSCGQTFDPAAIIPRDITDWKSHQQTVERAAPATINQRLAAVSKFFSWAAATGLSRTNPVVDVSGLRLNNNHPQALDRKQTRRLLREVHQSGNLRDVAIVELLLGAGLRVSEALSLQADDIIINDRSGSVTVRKGKGGQQRTIPLTAPVSGPL